MEKAIQKKRRNAGSVFMPAKSNRSGIRDRKGSGEIRQILKTGEHRPPEMVGPRSGQTLPRSVQDYFEPRFGCRFNNVRIHTGPFAKRAAKNLNARAFTFGSDIYFAKNQYSPGSTKGKHLLAHELTHTLHQQQDSVKRPAMIQRSYCPEHCQEMIRQGKLCRADRVTRDNCAERDAADKNNKITHIRVLRSRREVNLFWNGAPRTATGTMETITCNPHPSDTPAGWDVVGNKCGENHTNWDRYNMAWFTAFRSTGMQYGFHNSQPLTGAPSGGCVRVSCEDARRINENSGSNFTSIMVRG